MYVALGFSLKPLISQLLFYTQWYVLCNVYCTGIVCALTSFCHVAYIGIQTPVDAFITLI